jgi:hypothetical protein
MTQVRKVTHDGLRRYLGPGSIAMIAELPGSVVMLLRDGTVWARAIINRDSWASAR